MINKIKIMIRKIYVGLIAIVTLLASCKGMYDNLEQYAGEIVYPAKFDTIVGFVGYERAEINLMKAGRIPAKDIKLGKASKTVIEYDDQQIVIDSLVSWVNVTGLTHPKLYRIRAFTLDEYGNKSVPQELAVIPYTEADANSLSIAAPRILASPGSAVIDWPNGLNSILLDYVSLSFSYTDKDGQIRTGTREANPRIFFANLAPGQNLEVLMNYKIVPKVNGKAILDTITLNKPLNINIPTLSTPFNPSETAILNTNGITSFTALDVQNIEKLTFPIHTVTLQDLFYFPNVKEVDLTGGNLFKMRSQNYNRNDIVKTVGGGEFSPFVRRLGDMPAANVQTLVDLMNEGVIKKVVYRPNSLGIDAILKPFVEKGIVHLVQTEEEPLLPINTMFIDGSLQDNNWKMNVEVNPATYPSGADIKNVIKSTILNKNGSFILTLPLDYEFDAKTYRYLKFKVYAPSKDALSGSYEPFQRLWPRFMNYLWAFTTESPYGQQSWAPDANNYRIPDADLQNWKDITVDLSNMDGKHNRVIVINIGGEPSMTWATPPKDITYYFANFRFAKSK